MTSSAKLPRWQSHKVVEADKIVEVSSREPSQSNGARIVWLLACGVRIHASDTLLNRVPKGLPSLGGYYVRYEDGFESWSPARAFEEGYTRLEGDKGERI